METCVSDISVGNRFGQYCCGVARSVIIMHALSALKVEINKRPNLPHGHFPPMDCCNIISHA